MSDSDEQRMCSTALPIEAVANAGRLTVASELSICQEALRASEARFRSVVDGSQQGIIIQQEAHIVYANPAMAALFGYNGPEDMIGLNPFEDLIAGDLSEFRSRTAAAYRGARLEPTPPWRARHRTGRLLWISSTAHVSEWHGRPAVTSFYTDVTARQLAEMAVRDSEARYRSALQAARMAAWETDLIGATRTWTPEGLALFGLALPDGRGHVGGPADELLARMHPDDRHLLAHYHALAETTDGFSAEYRIVRPDGSVTWLSGRGQVLARTPTGKAHRLINVMVDITERKHSEQQVQFLLREMSHRTKNLLFVVQAIARKTAGSSGSLPHFEEAFQLRLRSLAASHDLLVRVGWERVPLHDLVREQLAAFIDPDSPRLAITGPPVAVPAETAQALGLAMHELATNAVKHGALSTELGRVDLTWQTASEAGRPVLALTWREHGGPPVAPPRRRGFGHTVLERMVVAPPHGTASLSFPTTGVVWAITVPLSPAH